MVFFELGLGKLAGTGFLKLAATGSSSTAVAALGPPPLNDAPGFPTPLDAGVPYSDVVQVAGWAQHPGSQQAGLNTLQSITSASSSASSFLWPKLSMLAEEIGEVSREMATSALSVTAPVVQASLPGRALELFGATAAVFTTLSRMGLLDGKAEEQDGDEKVRLYKDTMYFPPALFAFAVGDIVLSTALIDSIGAPLVVPLRLFAFGSLLLSFPADYFIGWLKTRVGFRRALLIELAATAVSLFWLTWGTHLLSVAPMSANTAPLLFWACFVHCVLTWSGFSAVIIATLLSSALTAWASGGPK